MLRLSLLPFFALTTSILQAEFAVHHVGGGLLIEEKGEKVFFYQRDRTTPPGGAPRAHYIHPLYGPDGTILTENAPESHPHHRGIYTAWTQVLIQGRNIGHLWMLRDVQQQVVEVSTIETEDGLTLHTTVYWLSPNWTNTYGEIVPFMREETTVYLHPSTNGVRVLDFTMTLFPLAPEVALGGTPADAEYGGFSYRIKLPEGLTFLGQQGEVEPTERPLIAGAWMDIHGPILASGDGGILVIQHPDNPGFPQQWVVRREGSMQNVRFPGPIPVILDPEEDHTLRYRMVVYAGDLTSEQIEVLAAEYD